MAHPPDGFYRRNGLKYPSYSTVIGDTDEICDPEKVEGIRIWRNKEEAWEEIQEDACERGKILHYRIEKRLGAPVKEFEMPDENRLTHLQVDQYVKFASPFIKQLIAAQDSGATIMVEQEKFSDDVGFGCTTDMNLGIGFIKKGHDYLLTAIGDDQPYSVWDWKNIRPPQEGKEPKAKPRSHHKSNFLQLGANALAHNEMVAKREINEPLITQGVICALYSWRAPRFHVLNLQELTDYALQFAERAWTYQQMHGIFPAQDSFRSPEDLDSKPH